MLTETVQNILGDLPSFYAKEDTSVNALWIKSFADEFDEFETNLAAAKLELFAQTATDGWLERIGLLVDVTRDPGETDDELRQEILNKVLTFIGGGTLGALVQGFLNRFSIEIEVNERADFIPWLRVFMDYDDFTASGITYSTALSYLQEIKAAGVGVTLGYKFVGSETVIFTEQPNPIINGKRFGRYNDGLSFYNDITVYK